MGYCENYLKKEKGSVVKEIAFIVCAIPIALLGALIVAAMVYGLVVDETIGLIGALFGTIIGGAILFIAGALCWGAQLHRKKRLNVSADVENSTLVRSIRNQMPPEQANLPVPELFALVDKDLEGGQSFAGITLGRTWVLLGAAALLLSNVRGIFLLKRTRASSKVVATVYEVEIYGPVRLVTFLTSASKREASDWLEKLAAAAPHAQTGGAKEQAAFLEAVRAQVEKAQQQ